ncbi:pyridoxal phosphate-dependent aminotransferase [Dongia sp.]|uniref:pyridoxal phosphate-dependent aminotransferase n=1 Tax=Dongia sp. TaxID=1977262 RepID=UPI003750EE1C
MNTAPRSDALQFQVRPEIKTLPDSGIVEVWKMGFTVPDVIGLWVGEGDLPTTRFICDAAAQSLNAGETFYTYKGGIPELRQGLSAYYKRHWNIDVSDQRIIVTSSGMNAMVLIVQTLCGAGDNAVCISPSWPNIFAAIQVMGAEPRQVALTGDEKGWHLDMEKLFAACDARTKAIYLASPGNPTGWVMPEDQRRALLDFARQKRIAIIADEVYGRLIYDGRSVAPSFLEIAGPDDPVFVVNSFSKTWAMTGWRVGWIVAPQAITHKLEMLIEYNTSGGQTFTQRACVVALEQGEEWVKWMIDRCRQSRDVVMKRVAQMNRVQVIPAEAAFYLMLRVEDMGDATDFCKRLVVDGRVGLAPGTAFGAGGEQYVRLCYAQSPERIGLAMDRLAKFLSDR